MRILMKAIPLLRPLDIFSQPRYMRIVSNILKSAGVALTGEPLWISPSIYIDCKEQGIVTLGHRCVLSEKVILLTHDYSLDRYSDQYDIAPPDMQYEMTAPVVIGDYAFIGIQAIIMPGVTVGEGAIVGSGSVVTKSVEPGTIVAGNPAREIGTVEDAWQRNQSQWKLLGRRS